MRGRVWLPLSLLWAALLFALPFTALAAAEQRYPQLGLHRSTLAVFCQSLDIALAAGATAAVLSFVAATYAAPAIRAAWTGLPRAPRITLVLLLAGLAILRGGWGLIRTEYYTTLSRSLGSLGTVAILSLLLIASAAVSLRLRESALSRRIAAGSLAALLLLWLSGHAALRVAPAAGTEGDRPNVLLVSLDALRADRVSCYGHSRPTTPGLDELARKGVIFETAITTAPWTLPSHASMLTGLYPHHHEAIRPRSLLARRNLTLAELLREAGYATAAFTGGGHLSDRYGFAQGFDVYEILRHESTSETVARGLRWLEEERHRPFFLFLHTYEPHMPFRDPRFADPEDAGRVGPSFERDDLLELRRGEWNPTPAERRYISDLYDGDARSTDAGLQDLWAWLERRGEIDRTLIIVTSDHGEELFERGHRHSARHGHTLYEELIRVPLILRYPPVFPEGSRVAAPVSLVDLAPTVAAAVGCDWPAQSDGLDLSEAIGGRALGSRPGVLTEALGSGAQRRSLRTARYKIVMPLEESGGTVELYDLAADPGERRNIVSTLPEVASRLARVLERFPPLPGITAEAELDQDLADQLRALGYVQ